MKLKLQLTTMSFLQFFVWGAWLITISNYWFETKGWGGAEFGAVFSTLGFSSILMPPIIGIIADRWINAERLYGVLHLCYASVLLLIPSINDPNTFFWVMFLAMIFYMPTISLSYATAYSVLKKHGNTDVIKDFPAIRVWGTIGFIIAMWITNLTGNKATGYQFYIAAFMAFVLGLYSFTLPKSPPLNKFAKESSLLEKLGLNALSLFKSYKMAVFFLFSMLLGVALQLTNMYGDVFISDFNKIPKYADSLIVKYSTVVLSISQISETIFILAIPFFLKKFGIKWVMFFSMIAWVLRFVLFAYGNPAEGLWMIIISCIIYGFAFDFFNISGSLFVETTTDEKIRGSAQGLFMMMSNGLGAVIGSFGSGFLIQCFFTDSAGNKDWHNIWLSFSLYVFIISILFVFIFKHKHKPEKLLNLKH